MVVLHFHFSQTFYFLSLILFSLDLIYFKIYNNSSFHESLWLTKKEKRVDHAIVWSSTENRSKKKKKNLSQIFNYFCIMNIWFSIILLISLITSGKWSTIICHSYKYYLLQTIKIQKPLESRDRYIETRGRVVTLRIEGSRVWSSLKIWVVKIANRC